MSLEEYNGLKPGDHVWVSRVMFSDTGTNTLGLLAELVKIESKNKDEFKVVKVEKGTSLREDWAVTPGYYSFNYPNVFKSRKDAIEHWNNVIYNTLDRLTSKYEQTIKRVKKKILKDD
jgi:predicted lipase